MKIFNIGKANAEIERLQSEIATAKAEAEAAKENATTLEQAAEQASADAEKAKKEISDRDARIQALEKELAEVKGAAEKIKTDFEAKAQAIAEREKNLSAEVEQRASARAQEIAASLGTPPLGFTPPAPGGKQDFKALVAAQVAAGKKKAEAIQLCVKSNPAEYAEWRKSGNTQTL